jgi:2-amino-4-hydroxy-6-hydroxymethyldihydropteridine diphosphokinase
MATDVFVGLGSNVGERLVNLQQATDLLGSELGVRIVASSQVWETQPVGGPPQPDFLNAVLRIETTLSPEALLDACGRVEDALGRVRDVRWGPRTIDVDILLFGEQTVDLPRLQVPHPRMLERAFVLLPLLELDPDAATPEGIRLADVHIDEQSGVRRFAPPLAVSR